MNKLFENIKFWIITFFGLRLIGITNAPLERGHNWRQSLTNMISRNLYENGYNFFHPQIDYAGELTGIIGAEFPFFNLLSAGMFDLFGFEHWIGRLINLIVSSFGIYAFYLLVKRFFNSKTALYSGITLLVSGWFMFSRKIMPDTFSISLMLIALWQGVKFLDFKKFYNLFLFFCFALLGILVKLPSIVYFSLFALIPFSKNLTTKTKITFITTSIICFGIGSLWYFYWVPHLVNTYHYQLYFTKGFTEGLLELKNYIPELLQRFHKSALQSYVALITFMIGIIIAIKKSQTKPLILFVCFLGVFCLFIVKTGSVFPLHNYYIIPFTPIMAIAAGYAISKTPNKFAIPTICLISIEGIANQQHDFFIRPSDLYKETLESFIKPHINPDDKIIVNGGQNPQMIYFAHRKGWTIFNDEIKNKKEIEKRINWGAKFLVIDVNHYKEKLTYPVTAKNSNYTIYQLY